MNDDLTCEVVDNFVFNYSGGVQVYDHLVNVSVDQKSRFSRLNIEPKYTATFEENDPYRAIYNGRVPSTAAFQDKIDGAGFKRTGCDFTVQESKMNVKTIKYIYYKLPALQ